MDNHRMSRYFSMLSCLIVIGTFYSCKKESAETPKKQEHLQYFKATVDNKPVGIELPMGENRELYNGSWTGVGMANGEEKEMYTVHVALPKELLNSNRGSVLRFQIFDIKKKEYQISNDAPGPNNLSSHVFLWKDAGAEGETTYSTSSLKKPFKVEITKYESPYKSNLRTVGGKLSGVLYNTKNLMDSIVIQNGSFEVGY